MPGYKAHVSFGSIIYFALIFTLVSFPGWIVGMRWFLLVVAGALFPDIDTHSKGRIIYTWFLLVVFVLLLLCAKVYVALFVGVLAFVPLLAKHRGLLHNFWFIAACVLLSVFFIGLISPVYKYAGLSDAGFFLLGVFSHLVLDRGFVRALHLR